ncbi:MAG: hypothetical protein ABSE47_13810, partial [Acidimicrobiales bacterium]
MTGPQGELAGASCTAATCTAVGSSTNSSGTGVPLVEVRKGTKWAIQTTPSPAGALSAGLAGVSCTGASACTAVGDYTNSSGTEVTLAEVRKGTTWAIQKTPNPTGSKGSSLSAVSCTGASACTAVGDYVKTNGSGVTAGTVETLAEVWNGTNWKVQPTPNHAGGNSLFGRNNSLFGVSCTRASACTAVGSYLSSTDSDEMLVEVWNGTNWKIQAIPNPAGSGYNDLAAVSCTGSTACTAVGETFQGSSGQGPLAEVRNGTSWKVQTTPSPTGEQFSKLTGVSCSGASACTAVGSATNISGTQGMFTEVRKSTSWKIQATASPPGAKSSSLTGVSCSAASACTAAGGDGDRTNSPYLTLAEVWNGSSWKIQATSNGNGAQPSNLAGVSCIGLSTCTAVGDGTSNRGAQVTLAEVWNGANWKIHATATPTGAQSAGLAGVSCTSPS